MLLSLRLPRSWFGPKGSKTPKIPLYSMKHAKRGFLERCENSGSSKMYQKALVCAMVLGDFM